MFFVIFLSTNQNKCAKILYVLFEKGCRVMSKRPSYYTYRRIRLTIVWTAIAGFTVSGIAGIFLLRNKNENGIPESTAAYSTSVQPESVSDTAVPLPTELGRISETSDISSFESIISESEYIPYTEEFFTETAATVPEPSTTAPPETEPAVITYSTFIACGDNLIHWSMQLSGQQPDGSFNYDHLYRNISYYVSNADMALINQEVPMGGTELGLSTYPCFNVPYEIGDAAVNAGFDMMTLATNHVLDKQQTGVRNMIGHMQTCHPQILLTGAYTSQEARDTIPIYQYNGFKIAILNYTYGTNGQSVAESYMVNYLNRDLMAADIAKARQQADFIIVCPHWGEENMLSPTENQRSLAQFFADNGVDLVIGTHPHVPQPFSRLTNCDGEPMYVYYSLGNLISQQYTTEQMLGEVARITFAMDETNHKIAISDASMDFTVTYYEYDPNVPVYTNMTTYMWQDFTPEMAEKHGSHFFDETFSYEKLNQYVQSLSVCQ